MLLPIIGSGGAAETPISPSSDSYVVVNGVSLGPAELLGLQMVLGYVFPGSYWSVPTPSCATLVRQAISPLPLSLLASRGADMSDANQV